MFGQDDQQDQTNTDNQSNQQNDSQFGTNMPTPPPSGSGLITPDPAPTDDSLPNDPIGTSPLTPPEPTDETSEISSTPAPEPVDTTTSQPTGDLEQIKTEALEKLSPLVDRLDQAPEEKFRTIMMMIQATDNQDMVKTAYKIAQDIENESERAKALLAVVNEIEYFSQQGKEKS